MKKNITTKCCCPVGRQLQFSFFSILLLSLLSFTISVPGFSQECTTDAECQDLDRCTQDICDSLVTGACIFVPFVCTDNNACTSDTCDSLAGCVFTPVSCDDANPCTSDTCQGGICLHTDQSPTVSAGADVNVFPAYPPAACATLTATASGGVGTLNFSWSTGATTASITVCPTVSTDYCVSVTDANGCVVNDCVRVCARNIACGPANRPNTKVVICHRTGSVRNPTVTICVAQSAVRAHLLHGDRLGACGLAPCSAAFKADDLPELNTIGVEAIDAYPNPFSDELNITFTLATDSKVTLEIFSLTGQRLAVLFDGTVKAGETTIAKFTPHAASDAIMTYRLQTEQGSYFGKVTMTK